MFSSRLRRRSAPAGLVPRSPSVHARRFRPHFEVLEDRIVPTFSVSLMATPQTAVFGQAITLTATVGSDTPDVLLQRGDVLFQDGNTTLGDVPLPPESLPGFQAILPTTPALSVGVHYLTAVYQGVNFQGPGAPPNILATSQPVDETITAPPSPPTAAT